MGHSGAYNQRKHPHNACEHYPGTPVVAISEAQSDDAERQYQDEHLRMQVSFRELRQKRQSRDKKRQREAMDQAQGG